MDLAPAQAAACEEQALHQHDRPSADVLDTGADFDGAGPMHFGRELEAATRR
jgi:hypothetical protein